MSVIIKSNNIATKSIETLKMSGTTAQLEFDKYKARVLADGGVIRDEQRTLRAFESLFNAKMYGNMNTFVSGSFGLKLINNKIEKAYSIDGFDLVAYRVGTGVAPIITDDNAIDFASNTSQTTNAAFLTTENKILLSKTTTFGMGVRLKRITNDLNYLGSLGNHLSQTMTVPISSLLVRSGQTQFQIQKSPLSLTSYNAVDTAGLAYTLSANNLITYLSEPSSAKVWGYRDGIEATSVNGVATTELSSIPFYLDVGASYRTNDKQYFDGAFYDFISFNHATREQALALSRFN